MGGFLVVWVKHRGPHEMRPSGALQLPYPIRRRDAAALCLILSLDMADITSYMVG
jgi:hypothetical protein